MKIIFLDIDGVLNSCLLNELSGYGGWFKEEDKCEHSNVLWGQKLVDNLKKIVDETNSKIVISSTWRRYFSVQKFQEMFSVYGWQNAPVIDKTDFFGSRGEEINKWLSENNASKYVIIDDCQDFTSEQQRFFINTDAIEGLSFDDAVSAIKILNS